jgi:proteasome lid subunit RPN8/RPN11
LARASSSARVGQKLVLSKCEQCWTLLGQSRGRVWYGRRVRLSEGQPTSVRFDALWALKREEKRHDVLGFFHTHPHGPAFPSTRDVRTMRAWCSSFGKPLLCVIHSPQGVRGYRFEDDQSQGMELVELFSRGVVIGVEADGEQVSS